MTTNFLEFDSSIVAADVIATPDAIVEPQTAPESSWRPALRDGVELTDVEGLGWILHNRADGKYARISTVGRELLPKLDGTLTLEELRTFLQETMQRPVSPAVVAKFIQSLADQGMLADRDAKPEKKKRKVQQLLHLRFPFFQGETIVGFATKVVQSVPKIPGVSLMLALMLVGMTAPFYFIAHGAVTTDLHLKALSWHTLGFLLPLMLLELILHELAHGVALTISGGRVREFGLGLHYFILPYSYTNTTDSYRLGRKERIFVSIAGPLVEFIGLGINSILLFTLAPDSPARPIVLLMMAFELSALIWNANPLLPFDGYLVLADTLKEPSLRKRGLGYIKAAFRKLLRRPVAPTNYTRWQKFLYVTYGVSAALYVLFLMSYLWLVAAMADPRVREAMLAQWPVLGRIVGGN